MSAKDCPTDAELIDFQDRCLASDRHDEIQRHLSVCSTCRERVRASDEIGRLLQMHASSREDPIGAAAVLARLKEGDREVERTRIGTRSWRPLLAGVAIILLAVGFVLPSVSALAGIRLDEAVERVSRDLHGNEQSLRGGAPVPHRPLSVRMSDTPFAAVVLLDLPGNLRLSQQQVSEGKLTLRYENDEGRVIDIHQSLASQIPMTAPATRLATVLVDGIEVNIERDLGGVPVRLFWMRDDVRFDLTVIHAPAADPSEAEFVAIAGALIAAPVNN